MKLEELHNDMVLQAAAHALPIDIKLYGDEETEHHGKWCTYRDSNVRLDKHRGQVFSMIMGQCMQQLLYKIKNDTYWTTVSTSYDPLALLYLIAKTVMSHSQYITLLPQFMSHSFQSWVTTRTHSQTMRTMTGSIQNMMSQMLSVST